MAVVSSLLIAALLILFICTFAPFVTSFFNSEHDARLASYAESGLRLYFTGFIFAGINIVGSAILSAVESVKYAFAASCSLLKTDVTKGAKVHMNKMSSAEIKRDETTAILSIEPTFF